MSLPFTKSTPVVLILAFALVAVASAQTPKPKAVSALKEDPDLALANKAALEWLALADAGKFDATWDSAALSFQKGQKRPDWSKGLGGARASVGKLISRTFLNQEVRKDLPNLPPGKYITVRFKSAFENRKEGAESVTLLRDGARGFRTISYFLG